MDKFDLRFELLILVIYKTLAQRTGLATLSLASASQWATGSRGRPGQSRGGAQMDRDAHTNTHSHVICYPICTVTKLPVTPGPSGGYTHSHTNSYTDTHKGLKNVLHAHTHARAHAHTQQRCSQCVIGGADNCDLSRSLEWAPTLQQPYTNTHAHTHSYALSSFSLYLANCVVDNLTFLFYCETC